MATLEELLALLPDNNVGAIDAADLRTIVTAIWNAGEDVEARVAALETAGGGSTSVTGRWQVNPQPGVDPGGMQVTSDTGDPNTATWLRFSKVDQTNTDMTVALVNAKALFAQQQSDASNWVRFLVSGIPTDGGSYVQVPVTVDDGAGTGAGFWQAAVIAITL